MKRMRKVALLLVAALAAAVLGGCGGSFDASAYVKALMDNSYKGDSSAFVEQEVGTKEQAEKLYEEGIDTEMSGITTGVQLSEELQGEFRDVLKDVFKNVKYTVGDATKKDNAYEVEVKYQKMNVFAPAMETFQADSEAYVAEMTEKAASGEDTPSEEEINEKVYSMLKDAIKGAMGSVTYGDEESTTVRIELKDKVWTPNEDDLYNLELLLFDSEAVTDAAQ